MAMDNPSRDPLPVVVDGHVDIPYFLERFPGQPSFQSLETGPFTPRQARESGVRLFAAALYCPDRFNGSKAFQHFQQLLQFTKERLEDLPLVNTRAQLDELAINSSDLQHLLLLENADGLAEDISYVEQLRDQGIIVVGLTHVGPNRLADGNHVFHSQGLSDLGRRLVEALVKNRVMVDVAHLHATCFWQLMRLTEAPVVSSHTGIRELYDTPRNLSLEQVRQMLERGGLVGITLNPEMLGPGEKGVERVFAHVDTLVQKFGPEGVGLGSDFCGFEGAYEDLGDISGIRLFEETLLSHGYGKEDLAGILGNNWLRVYGQALAGP